MNKENTTSTKGLKAASAVYLIWLAILAGMVYLTSEKPPVLPTLPESSQR